MRTSSSHPLLIAEVSAGAGLGSVGITFCPGKKQADALTGAWNRDLCLDLDAVRDWGAAAVVTLVEQGELESLGVSAIGQEVVGRHMDWLHLPIRDVSVPGEDFVRAWEHVGEGLRARLRDGFNVLVHCKGGLGRAGTVAARLLIELGWEPAEAIKSVRSVRPGAIETSGQEAHVRTLRAIPEREPSRSEAAFRDRALGALLGLAVGDALGTTIEFKTRDTYPLLTDIIGGGPFHLEAGQWTDDTAMALALADSLIAHNRLNEADLIERFADWADNGAYSCTGSCFDIGTTVSSAISRWRRSKDPVAGSTDAYSAGNGSLMRLAPVAIRYWADRQELRDAAATQSRTTHGAAEAVSACVLYAELMADAIAGEARSIVLRERNEHLPPKISEIAHGSWRGKPRNDVSSSGYVVHSLEAALWAVGRTGDFRSAVLAAANLGGDADTTAAIAGQLAGALYGLSGIPEDWLEKLAWRPRITGMAEALYKASRQGEVTVTIDDPLDPPSSLPAQCLHSERLTKAFSWASDLHAEQARKGTRVPYLSHLLGVASLAIEYGADEETLIAALLHDAVEDAGGEQLMVRLRRHFGERVARIVGECSDSVSEDKANKAPWIERKRLYVSQLSEKSAEACLVSACDKLHNALAILADENEARAIGGPPVWERFGKPPEQVVAYYSAVLGGLRGRIPSALERRLAIAVSQLETAVDTDKHAVWISELIPVG